MKATEHFIPVVLFIVYLFIMLYKVVSGLNPKLWLWYRLLSLSVIIQIKTIYTGRCFSLVLFVVTIFLSEF